MVRLRKLVYEGKQKKIDNTERLYLCSTIFKINRTFQWRRNPCCVDWSHKLVVGNVNSESLDHIWNSLCNKIRHQHIKNSFVEDSPCISAITNHNTLNTTKFIIKIIL